jgi:hypothetical protein
LKAHEDQSEFERFACALVMNNIITPPQFLVIIGAQARLTKFEKLQVFLVDCKHGRRSPPPFLLMNLQQKKG